MNLSRLRGVAPLCLGMLLSAPAAAAEMPGAGVPSVGLVLGALMILATTGYYVGRARAVRAGGRGERLHSLPSYHGYYVALWCGIPGALLFLLWVALGPHVVESLVMAALPGDLQSLPPDRLGLVLNDIRNIAGGSAFGGPSDPAMIEAARRYNELTRIGYAGLTVSTLALAALGLALARRKVAVRFRARVRVERTVRAILVLCSTISILITVGIVLSLLFEAIRFFRLVPIVDFLFGVEWSPQTAIRAGQVASAGAFGMVPLFTGTFVITAIAMLVAVPIGLMAAIQTAEYASRPARAVIKPVLELLAGIPTVVYGFFAALIVAPVLREAGVGIGLDIASESALAAGLVMGIMIIPFVSSISDDVITAVPQALRDGSYALGATRSETIRRIVIPAALPGIVGGVLLAVSRAIGETMIVVMAAGLAANLTVNPLEAVTTVTVQMVTLLVGDQEFESAKTLAAFALGLVLFLVTLGLNVVALHVVRKYRERYE